MLYEESTFAKFSVLFRGSRIVIVGAKLLQVSTHSCFLLFPFSKYLCLWKKKGSYNILWKKCNLKPSFFEIQSKILKFLNFDMQVLLPIQNSIKFTLKLTSILSNPINMGMLPFSNSCHPSNRMPTLCEIKAIAKLAFELGQRPAWYWHHEFYKSSALLLADIFLQFLEI